MRTMEAYKPFLDGWKPEFGKKPNIQEVNKAETLARQGSKTAFALAMGMRTEGVTQSTIVKVLGLPHRNKIRQLEASKKLRVKKTKGRPSVLNLDVR